MATKQPSSSSTKNSPSAETKRLFRSRTDRVLGGVAGGIAQYFDIDAVIIRIIFVFITIFGGSGILLYIILWLVIPDEDVSVRTIDETIHRNVADIKDSA